MRICVLFLLFASIALTGCDTISGVSRSAQIHALPDLNAVKARLESYPETKEVSLSHDVKDSKEVFHLSYTDHENVHGTLTFIRNDDGKNFYSQSLFDLNRSPPQSWIDATWPVMKKIEKDLIEEFSLPEIRNSVKITISRVEDPERKTADTR